MYKIHAVKHPSSNLINNFKLIHGYVKIMSSTCFACNKFIGKNLKDRFNRYLRCRNCQRISN